MDKSFDKEKFGLKTIEELCDEDYFPVATFPGCFAKKFDDKLEIYAFVKENFFRKIYSGAYDRKSLVEFFS